MAEHIFRWTHTDPLTGRKRTTRIRKWAAERGIRVFADPQSLLQAGNLRPFDYPAETSCCRPLAPRGVTNIYPERPLK